MCYLYVAQYYNITIAEEKHPSSRSFCVVFLHVAKVLFCFSH